MGIDDARQRRRAGISEDEAMAVDALGKGGTVTLPREFLEAADAEAGDLVRFEVTGPTTLTLTILPRSTPTEGLRPRVQNEAATDQAGPQPPPGNAPVDYDSLPRLSLAELLEQYPIEGPVDLKADREALYDEMAKDVFGERPDRFPS
jgi:antitoxin component of MazEF toxin-antitoxin module